MLKLQARTTVTPPFDARRPFPVKTTALHVVEEPLHGIIRVQVGPQTMQLRADIEAVLGLQLPCPERSTRNRSTRLAWTGPNEWLVFCALDDEYSYLDALTEKLSGHFVTVTLMSDSRVSFKVSGSSAADFLAKGCSIDLDEDAFPVDATVTTRFAGLPAMLVHANTKEYLLYFDVPSAGFVVDWIVDAAEEFVV